MNGEPSNWELSRRLDDLAKSTAEGNEMLRRQIADLADALRLSSAQSESTYLRKDVGATQQSVIDLQLQAHDEELHSISKRLDAAEDRRQTDRRALWTIALAAVLALAGQIVNNAFFAH